jgi:GR25 family glycosyltransferase involved in LPS biosynthesis
MKRMKSCKYRLLFSVFPTICIAMYIMGWYFDSYSLHATNEWKHALADQYMNHMHLKIEKIMVINLDRRIERMQTMYKQLNNLSSMKVERIPAVDGKLLPHHSLVAKGIVDVRSYQNMIENTIINGELMTVGGLGCYLSHVNVWKIVAQMHGPALIFEDDIILNGTFEQIEAAIQSLPKDFGIFYLANMVGEKIMHSLTDYNKLVYRMHGEQWLTSAYVLTPATASLLLTHALPARGQVDSYIIEMCDKFHIPTFMSKTNLIYAENSYGRESDVQRYKKLPVVIPKVFHKIWFGDITTSETKYESALKRFHPEWKIMTWNEQSIRELGLKLQPLIDRVNITAAKADIARYEILYKLGGVYIDSDIQPLRNIERIIGGVDMFVGYEDKAWVCNALMGSIPGHIVLYDVINDITASWDNPKNKNIIYKSGPYFLTKYVEKYAHRVQAFAPHIFYPYAWNATDPGVYPDSYAVHHWSRKWWGEVGWKL